MAKEKTEQQKALLRRARLAARAAGKDWSKLSKEERREYKIGSRAGGKLAQSNPVRQSAINAATAAGKDWKKLTVEERRSYLQQATKGS